MGTKQALHAKNEPSRAENIRLRLGLIMMLFWWLQLPVLVILVAPLFGYSPVSDGIAELSLVLMIIQNIVGGLGVLIAGRPLLYLVRKTPRKQLVKTLWRCIKNGALSTPATADKS